VSINDATFNNIVVM